jgi:hypothetical protein
LARDRDAGVTIHQSLSLREKIVVFVVLADQQGALFHDIQGVSRREA